MYKTSTSKMQLAKQVKPQSNFCWLHGSFWLSHETINSGILLHPLAVCGIWCLSHNHTLILTSSWIRYYYILTNFVYASLLNQLETSDTHTSFYHHRPQQRLGATFPSEGNNKWHHLRQYCIGISTMLHIF